MGKDNPVEALADAFKTEAMKSAWPKVSEIFANHGVKKAKDYDVLFDKKSNVTAMSEAGNRKLVDLSAAILDAVMEEFTGERADEVMAQTQNVQIKSKIRAAIDAERKSMETAWAKIARDPKNSRNDGPSNSERMEAAGLQSFFNQLENIDRTAVLKAKLEIEKQRAVSKGKAEKSGAPLSPVQLSHGKTTLVEYANAAKAAPSGKLAELAEKCATKLASKKIKADQLEMLFGMLDVFNTGAAVKWKDALKAALKEK